MFEPYVARGIALGEHRLDFLVADETGQEWYDEGGDRLIPERRWCLEHIRPGFTVVDCGGHHGLLSILFSLATGDTGRVLTWEASPRNAGIFARNVALNGRGNITLTNRALGAAPGSVAFHDNGGNTQLGNAAHDVASETVMQVHRLDDEIGAARVDFLKIDVEGSELAILQGAGRVLDQRPIIDLEIHNFLFDDPHAVLTAIFAILDARRYSYAVLPQPISEIIEVGREMRLDWLARFDNPHVFCTPA